MSSTSTAELMNQAVAHAQSELQNYKKLTIVPTSEPMASNVEALHKSILSEAEIVQRLVQCGDCD